MVVIMDRAAALSILFDEVVATFHRLRALAAELHGRGEPTAADRGVLRSLVQHGPQTVPQLARARPVSRQHIQLVVDKLLQECLVESAENPSHRRSKLVRPTAKGRALLAAMSRREARLLRRFNPGATLARIEEAAATLRIVNARLTRLRSSQEEKP